MEDEFYNLVVKENDLKTYIRRFQELALLCPNMLPNSKKLMEVFIEGLPRSVEGNVTASKPQSLEEVITITQRLMEQNKRQEAIRDYAVNRTKNSWYAGNLPITMSSLYHSTSNNEDAFSSNILDYVSTILNYFPASSGKTYSNTSTNSTGKIPPELSPFYNIQAFYAKELTIPSPDPITLPVILTPSLVLPPSLLFDPRYFFVPKKLLPPKKQIHLPSSLTTLSKLCRKLIYIYEPSSPLVHTPTLPPLYEPEKVLSKCI
nr:reverse transcriptase domain-containing protein [Tanacetum cinerariifolium]